MLLFYIIFVYEDLVRPYTEITCLSSTTLLKFGQVGGIMHAQGVECSLTPGVRL